MKTSHFALFFAGVWLVPAVAEVRAQGRSEGRNIVVIGASNANGKGVGRAKAYPAKLEAKLRAQGVRANVTNSSANGETTADLRRRLSQSIPKGTDTVVIQAAKHNDRRFGVDTKSNMQAIKQELRAKGITVVVAKGVRQGQKQSDGVHLTSAGHDQVATGLARRVRQAR